MRRRAFIAGLGGAAAAPLLSPRLVAAQEAGRTYRVGFLIPVPRASTAVSALFDELRQLGFIEGQNLTVVPGGFDVRNDHVREAAAALIKATPDAIVAGPEFPLHALLELTRTIPLIGMTEDMVAAGLVASLARPGGNVTGLSILSPELNSKRQDLLIEMVPRARRMAALADSRVTTPLQLESLQQSARARGVELVTFGAAKPEDVLPAINAAKTSGAEAINFLATPLFSNTPSGRAARLRVAELRLPAIYQWPEIAREGGVSAYGPSFIKAYRQRARMLVKVLRGAKPADLPVEQPTNFEFVINLTAAKAIGHEIPSSVLLRADEVIE
jgi:putative ABC transport system substrate-binding protein